NLRRHVFLDNERTEAAIADQFEQLVNLARTRGLAVGIAHPYPETLTVLSQALPGLARRGVEIVAASRALGDQARPCPLRILASTATSVCDEPLALSEPVGDN